MRFLAPPHLSMLCMRDPMDFFTKRVILFSFFIFYSITTKSMVETRAAKRRRLTQELPESTTINNTLAPELLDHIFSYCEDPHTLRLVCTLWYTLTNQRLWCKGCRKLKLALCNCCQKLCCVCDSRRCEWRDPVSGDDDDFQQCTHVVCVSCSLQAVKATPIQDRTTCTFAILCPDCSNSKRGCVSCDISPCPTCVLWCVDCRAPLCNNCCNQPECCKDILCESCTQARNPQYCHSCGDYVCEESVSYTCENCSGTVCDGPDCSYRNELSYRVCYWCSLPYSEETSDEE